MATATTKGPELSELSLSWVNIIRLGLVQSALGAIVVLSTSTLNRVMVVELGLAALLPGVLVGLHYAVQISRPMMGLRVDVWGRSTPLILTGMLVLALSSILAAASVQLMAWSSLFGMAVAAIAFFGIGLGVSAAGTSLLALISRTVSTARRPAAATITWVMMIIGIIISAATAGQMLDPYSHSQLLYVTSIICLTAVAAATFAVAGVERRYVDGSPEPTEDNEGEPKILPALAAIWHEPNVRQFAIFVFVSMLAYSAQDLILEPYAGLIFGLSVGESTALAATQHQGVLLGMVMVGLVGGIPAIRRNVPMVTWTLSGCVLSALGLAALTSAILWASAADLPKLVFFLGFGNGVFAVGAIGSMFSFARNGIAQREGTRVGIWGAAQAIAFALGGILATSSVDLIMTFNGTPALAYGAVFAAEALLFLIAAILALKIVARQGAKTTEKGSLGQIFTRGIATLEGVNPVATNATQSLQKEGTL